MATKKKAPKTSDFSITLKLGPDVYSGAGSTPFEALHSLPRPEKIMAKGVLTLKAGDKERVRPLTPVQAKRLFYIGSTGVGQIIAKQLFSTLT